MLAALMAGQRQEGQRGRVPPGGPPTASGSPAPCRGPARCPPPYFFPRVCVSISFFLPVPPASPSSMTLCVSLVPLTSP